MVHQNQSSRGHFVPTKNNNTADPLRSQASLTIEIDGELQTFSAAVPRAWEPLLTPLGEMREPEPEPDTEGLVRNKMIHLEYMIYLDILILKPLGEMRVPEIEG